MVLIKIFYFNNFS